MEYIIMSLEDAKKVAKKDAVVLVSKQDLENPDCNIGFKKKKFGECYNILEEAATIALEYFQIFKLEFLKEICIRFYLGNPKFVYYHLKSNVCSAIIKNRKQPICFKRCWRT